MELTITLSDQNNKGLANLCGVLDENIKQIANGFDIQIQRRGSNFQLKGKQGDVELASQLIESLSLRSSRSISAEDIQLSLIEVSRISSATNQSPDLA